MSKPKHLTDIASLDDTAFFELLDGSLDTRSRLDAGHPPACNLSGKLQFNLFYENSTRTNLSFEVAGKRLGAIVSIVPVAASSVHKGETLEDTVLTFAAQGADFIIIRAAEPHTINRAIQAIHRDGFSTSIVNAGEGTLGHPTQGLLDAGTVLRALGRRPKDGLNDQTIAICGDIVHSRVAASAIECFSRLGATLHLCGPRQLLPQAVPPEVDLVTDDLDMALDGANIAMGLRLQKERMTDDLGIDEETYHARFGLTHGRMVRAKPSALVMHPGPMNRGIEISSGLADDPERSLIRSQVTQGVALRMALLAWLNRQES